ncbi:MAG: hypothetical protein EA375_04910 [Acholeplasmataceae bacterium]|nr:MAG: hypothetical protein EA375_04910 [Acholeplasmataceae bacterium]
MKQAFYLTLLVTAVLNVWLFPTTDPVIHEDQAAMLPPAFTVEIMGEVVFPGTYHFYEPVTLDTVITLAGGLTDEADWNGLHFGELISGKRQVTVHRKQTQESNPVLLVNVNTASFQELLLVPGINEQIAVSLLVYRESHGPFQHVDDLIKVKYIGPVTLEKIRPYVTLN